MDLSRRLFVLFVCKQRKRETASNHHNVIDFKVFRAVQVILSALQSLKTAFDKTSINMLKPSNVKDTDISASGKTDYYYEIK